MKAENKKKAIEVADLLLPAFKGLSEKSATKMVFSIEKSAVSLSKKFHKLQHNDCSKMMKKDKKMLKKMNFEIGKEKFQQKVATIIATEKPKIQLELPMISKKLSKNHTAKKGKTILV